MCIVTTPSLVSYLSAIPQGVIAPLQVAENVGAPSNVKEVLLSTDSIVTTSATVLLATIAIVSPAENSVENLVLDPDNVLLDAFAVIVPLIKEVGTWNTSSGFTNAPDVVSNVKNSKSALVILTVPLVFTLYIPTYISNFKSWLVIGV